MEKEKIARINALAHKAKTSGLTEAELAERDALRQEYLADIRASMIDQLEHTTVIEPDGTRRRYGLPVPAHHNDPVAAAADLYGWPVEAYRQLEVRR